MVSCFEVWGKVQVRFVSGLPCLFLDNDEPSRARTGGNGQSLARPDRAGPRRARTAEPGRTKLCWVVFGCARIRRVRLGWARPSWAKPGPPRPSWAGPTELRGGGLGCAIPGLMYVESEDKIRIDTGYLWWAGLG